LKKHPRMSIILALEMVCGSNLPTKEAAKLLNIPYATVCAWMTCYWFYKKPSNPIIITLKSDV